MTMSKQAKADKEKAKLAKLKAEELAKEKAKQAEIEAIEQLNLQVGATVGETLEQTPNSPSDLSSEGITLEEPDTNEEENHDEQKVECKVEVDFYIADHMVKVNGIFYETGAKIPKV